MIYIILAAALIILQIISMRYELSSKTIKICKKSILAVIILVGGIRFHVGTDYQHYTNIYNALYLGEANYVETVYRYFNYLFFVFGDKGIYALIFVSSTIVILSFDYYINTYIDSDYYFLSWFFIISTGILFASFNAIRQYLAVALIILSLRLLINRKYLMFLIITIIATQLHTSAAVVILLVPIMGLMEKSSKKSNIILISIYMLSLVFLIVDFRELLKVVWFVVPERWQWYIVSDFFNERNSSAILKQILPNLLVFLGYIILKIKGTDDLSKRSIYINVSCFILFVSLSNIFYGIMVLQRFTYYFELAYIFAIVYVYQNVKYLSRIGSKVMLSPKNIRVAISLYMIIFLFYLVYIRNAHDILPYRTILEVFI